jgi:hypothetical protein
MRASRSRGLFYRKVRRGAFPVIDQAGPDLALKNLLYSHIPDRPALVGLHLNRRGARLTCDGIFGPRTRAAVVEFQRMRRIRQDGVVGEDTWSRLVHHENLPIVDSIDVWDHDLYKYDAQNIINVGGKPVLMGSMSRGVVVAAQKIRGTAGNIFLLRF